MERDVTLLAGCAGQTIRYANPPCFSSNTLFAGLARGPVVTLTKQKSSPNRNNRSGSFIYQPTFAVLLRPCTPQPILVIVDRLSALERRSDRVTMGNGFCARRELRSSRSPVYRQRRRRAPCRPSWWEIVSDRRTTKTAAKHPSGRWLPSGTRCHCSEVDSLQAGGHDTQRDGISCSVGFRVDDNSAKFWADSWVPLSL